MCIIIDTNKISYFFDNPHDNDTKPIHNWINKNEGKVVFAMYGKHKKELRKNFNAMTKLLEFSNSGKAKLIEKAKVETEKEKVKMIGYESDDIHILALARAGGARLLYTADEDLKSDFKRKEIIDNPRGKIYSNANHKHLLNKDICNPGK